MSLASNLSTLWNDRRDVQWAVSPSAPLGYLGWLNRGNLGDEAMFRAHRAVSSGDLRGVPMQKVGWRLARRGRVGTLVLGGGTLIGRREWTSRIEHAVEILRPGRLISLGVGVEDFDFALERDLISEQEINRQVDLLRSFDRIGVRGPRSADTLSMFGLKVEVLGDPAIALEPPVTKEPNERPRVLLSLANVSNSYRDTDPSQRMRMHVARAAHRFAASVGGTLTGLAMEPRDKAVLQHAMPSQAVWTPRNVSEVTDGIANADFVIGERLHANVLAAAMRTKFVAIGYKPKTFDFIDSLGAGSVIDSRHVAEDYLYEEAMAVYAETDHKVSSGVALMSERFRSAASQELS